MEDLESFVAGDGITIAYRRTAAGSTPSSGLPPVVLLHGLASTSEISWVAPGMVDRLAAAGRDVVVVDARGHGASDTPHDPASYGEARMSRDLIELWDHLGLASVDLVGHSMGAIVAMLTAAEDHRVRRLVLSGVGAYQLDYDGTPLRHFDAAGFAAALRAAGPDAIDDAGMAEFRREIDASDNDRLAIAAHLTVLHDAALPLARITVPTLVLNGADDPLSPRPEQLAAALPDARSVVLPGDHVTTKTTTAFMDAVIEFLSS